MHHRLYQERSNSEKLFHTGAAEMSFFHVAGHIQDDTDLTRL
jgi:hypothetical protein